MPKDCGIDADATCKLLYQIGCLWIRGHVHCSGRSLTSTVLDIVLALVLGAEAPWNFYATRHTSLMIDGVLKEQEWQLLEEQASPRHWPHLPWELKSLVGTQSCCW